MRCKDLRSPWFGIVQLLDNGPGCSIGVLGYCIVSSRKSFQPGWTIWNCCLGYCFVPGPVLAGRLLSPIGLEDWMASFLLRWSATASNSCCCCWSSSLLISPDAWFTIFKCRNLSCTWKIHLRSHETNVTLSAPSDATILGSSTAVLNNLRRVCISTSLLTLLISSSYCS
jgi:hypothetical protein